MSEEIDRSPVGNAVDAVLAVCKDQVDRKQPMPDEIYKALRVLIRKMNTRETALRMALKHYGGMLDADGVIDAAKKLETHLDA